MRYIIDEYFYSDIDKGFFEYNLLKTILNRIGLNEDDRGMTVKEWNSVRRMAGKPRRFSQVLVNQELEQLNTFRERARVWVNKKQLINDGLFPKELTLAIQNLIPMQVVGRQSYIGSDRAGCTSRIESSTSRKDSDHR